MGNTLNISIISIVIIFLVLLLFFAIFLSTTSKNTTLRTSLTTKEQLQSSKVESNANLPLGHQLLLGHSSKFEQQGFRPVAQNVSNAVLMNEEGKFVTLEDNKVTFTETPEMSYSYVPSSNLLVVADDNSERVLDLNGEKQLKMLKKGNEVIISTQDMRILGNEGVPLKLTLLAKRN